jgi:luciferase family oxidoreductase group 1
MPAHHDTRLRVGVLSFGDLPHCIDLAERVDALGYSRLWLAEHHGEKATSGSPEILTAILAGLTRNLRVGSGGVLLHCRAPLKVAEDFRSLTSLFPGRIDLGFCRGAVDAASARSLGVPDEEPAAAMESFTEKVRELLALLTDALPGDHPHAGAVAVPRGAPPPEPWSLGSGPASARIAAENGVGYGYALHLGPDDPVCMRAYRASFRPGPLRDRPACVVSVAGVCAETSAEATRLFETAAAKAIKNAVVGTPAACREAILRIRRRFEVDEIVWVDLAPAADARLLSHELLAGALGLSAERGEDR